MRTATFYTDIYPLNPLKTTHSYGVTLEHIRDGLEVHTTQMCLLNAAMDYDLIRIVEYDAVHDERIIEIRNNHDGTYECAQTDRTLRYANNLFKLWENGAFDKS